MRGSALDNCAYSASAACCRFSAAASTTFDRAESVWPYDTSLFIADTSPTVLPPPDDGGCGILRMIFVAVVVAICHGHMQSERPFRDPKNVRWDWGCRRAKPVN